MSTPVSWSTVASVQTSVRRSASRLKLARSFGSWIPSALGEVAGVRRRGEEVEEGGRPPRLAADDREREPGGPEQGADERDGDRHVRQRHLRRQFSEVRHQTAGISPV